MRVLTTDPLFAWNRLEDCPSLSVIKQMLDLIPDGPLLKALRECRGHGRNDCPVHVAWRTHLVRYMLRHPTMDAALAELQRNTALREVVGLEVGMKVPQAWNMSRFLETLGRPEHLALMGGMFEQMARKLALAVPELGCNLAGDSSALSARGDRDAGKTSLPQPDGAKKQYLDDQGKVLRIFEWFGYKFHLLVDVKHEVVLAFELTPATTADCSMIPSLLKKSDRVLPLGRVKTLAYDKAADSGDVHKLLSQACVKPLIEIRNQWKDQTEQMLPGHDGNSNVVHDEAGTIYCYDKVSFTPVKHKMGFMGYEKSRGTLKYRCPARHEGWSCPSDKQCNGNSCYGKTVRVKCELDLRRFPPIPRGTQEFQKRYDGRTAVERANARLKLFWGADDGNVSGAARFHAHMHTVLLVHIGFATLLSGARRYEGRSLSPTRLSVITRRLQETHNGE
jgi:hypothetical protein